LRWDPHLHAPGTLRNDQFGGDWEGYIARIEGADPAPVALGITDYFSVRCYKEVRRRRNAGALRDVALIFPNIEIRLTIETRDRHGINLHLLVSPEDPDHVTRIEEKLGQLRFPYGADRYACTEDGLKRLGRAHRGDPELPDEAALAEGANQFKVELSEIRELWQGDPWFRSNVLIAVAAGNDGLAGLAKDAAFHAQREELGRFAQVVFSGNPQDRAYWLGQHPDFEANRQTPKPCLHGSDAHAPEEVLAPAQARRCWIRAEPTFDGLRQTLVEPARRVHLGENEPEGAASTNVIRSFRLRNAPWLVNQNLTLNDGLVTIIGVKGSGKTALADMLAFTADASDAEPGPASFIDKARDLLHGVEAEIEWADGTLQAATLPDAPGIARQPRVRYLSQQFVERLCSSERLGEPLVEEIERVVFDAIPEEERWECATFGELRMFVLEGPKGERDAEREEIRVQTRLIADEIKLQRSLESLRAKLQGLTREREGIEKQVAAIPLKVDPENVKAQQAVAAKLKQLREAIAAEGRRAQQLRDLEAEIQRQVRGADAQLQALKAKYGSLLTDPEWELLRFKLDDEAFSTLTRLRRVAEERTESLRERGVPVVSDGQPPALGEGLRALEAENERLTKELGLDQANVARRLELDKRLGPTKLAEENATKELNHAQNSPARQRQIQGERLTRYEAVFRALQAEEEALRRIYEPLRRRLQADSRLSKLSLVVERVVDVEAWASRGETLVDLRRPPFGGKDALAELARKDLLKAWKGGSPQDARQAMEAFINQHGRPALEVLAHGVTPLEFGEWVFSTDHITVRYGIQYEGVDVVRLSPGMRGVVLLTLYLALDEWDHRPLVIDQPEENLDPLSVYTDLVPFFREAATRRQIIMVTHNANLVVNTDSDQVIVAEAERKSPTELPMVTYHAGPLEDPEVRKDVCRLLEGGEDAFRKRGQRYKVS